MNIKFIQELIKSTIKENLEVDIYTSAIGDISSTLNIELKFKGDEEPFYTEKKTITTEVIDSCYSSETIVEVW
jgi:hypothetical protein